MVNTKTDSILIEVRRTERMKIILQLSVLLLLAATIEIASTCVDVKPDGCSVPSWVGWQGTFRRACNKHDMCYLCGAPGHRQWTKQECDDAFYRDLNKTCSTLNPGLLRTDCYYWAEKYDDAVRSNWLGLSGKGWNTTYCNSSCRPSEGDPNLVLVVN